MKFTSYAWRLSAILIVVVLMIASFGPVQAQSATCYGLAKPDCQLYQDALSQDSIAKLTSFFANYTIILKTTGLPQNNIDANVTGNGSFTIDPATFGSDTQKIMTGIGADNTTTVHVVSASTNINNQQVNWKILDNTLYFQLDPTTDAWQYTPLSADKLDKLSASSLVKGVTPSTSQSLTEVFQSPEVMATLAQFAAIKGFITAQAANGPKVEGQATRQITYNISLSTLLQAKEFRPALKYLFSQTNSGTTFTDAQLAQAGAMFAGMITGSKVNVQWLIGTTDKLIHGFGVHITFVLNQSLTTSAPQHLNAVFNFDTQLSKIGQDVQITAPDNATPYDTGAGSSTVN